MHDRTPAANSRSENVNLFLFNIQQGATKGSLDVCKSMKYLIKHVPIEFIVSIDSFKS